MWGRSGCRIDAVLDSQRRESSLGGRQGETETGGERYFKRGNEQCQFLTYLKSYGWVWELLSTRAHDEKEQKKGGLRFGALP